MKAIDCPIWNSSYACFTSVSEPQMEPSDGFVVGTMKLPFKNSKTRAEFSAAMIVAAVLAIGALAKSDVATQLFRLVH